MRMRITMIAVLVGGVAALSMPAYSDETPPAQADSASTSKAPPAKVHYKTGKDIDFEELLIQGQLQRPEITVVTGDSGQGTDGLLRLRENFLDQVAIDTGGEVK
jgi:hypothetical protein